jgi:flagellar basal-body rod modification protein FlgD
MAVSNVSSSNLGGMTAQRQGDMNAMGRDAFMKLLVAQLRNQDPEAPVDSKEFITQLSQLTSVEQLVTMSDRLASLEVGMASLANTQVAGIVGKTVVAETKSVNLEDGGSASVPVTLGSRAAKVVATFRNDAGEVVGKVELGDTFPGTRSLSWNGIGPDGVRVPAGRYRVEVSATDAAGRPVDANTRIRGQVSEISYANGYPEVVVGGARVMLGDVTSIGM